MGKTGYQNPGILGRIRQNLTRNLGTPTWETVDLPPLGQMQRLWKGVEDDTGHPLLVHFLARLIDVARVPPRDPVKLARAIQLYSARHIKFFRERPERFQSAVRTVSWGIGDCDDKARFIAASLRTFRIPTRLMFLHMTPPGQETKGHVYPEAWLEYPSAPSRWVPLESVREYPMGFDPAERARSRGYRIETRAIGDEGKDDTHI